jgi:hypothetical protein
MLGALYTNQAQGTATERLAGAPFPDKTIQDLADALGSGAGTLVADHVPKLARGWLTEIAQASSEAGLNAVLFLGGGLAALSAITAFVLIRGNAGGPPDPNEYEVEVAPRYDRHARHHEHALARTR